MIRRVTSLLSPSKNMQFCNEQIRTQPLFSPPCASATYGSARMCTWKNVREAIHRSHDLCLEFAFHRTTVCLLWSRIHISICLSPTAVQRRGKSLINYNKQQLHSRKLCPRVHKSLIIITPCGSKLSYDLLTLKTLNRELHSCLPLSSRHDGLPMGLWLFHFSK